MDIITCKAAKAKGLKHYFTGRPCKYGHVDVRYVTGGCATCQREHTKKCYAKHSQQKNKQTCEWREANRDGARAIQRAYYARNSNKIRAEQTLIRAKRLQRVPPWCEKDIILQFYLLCPEGMQVDHELPLQGEFVSGLHVLDNLQYLTEGDNKAKRHFVDLEEYNKCISI
jgi:hypothetical protein